MPSYIVKVEKDQDLYVLWSTVTESPHAWGTKDELAWHMVNMGLEDDLPARFKRADETGTSSRLGWYNWNDGGFIYEQRGLLRRDRLAQFLETFDPGSDSFDHSFLEPFEEDQ